MRRSGKGSGGGLGMNKVVHRPHGKTEPRPHARNPARVAQYGQMQGTHITHGKESSYRGEPDFTRSGYATPVGISDPVKAVGVGGGRTIYEHGTQCQTGTNPGNPRPNPRREALEQE
jgi:hypothetical protein